MLNAFTLTLEFGKIKHVKSVKERCFCMIHSDVIRGHLETIILKLILEKDRYGYEISRCIKERTNEQFIIKEASLYSIVQRLEKKGLISSYMGEKTHGGKRRYYEITPLGKAYYKEKLIEWHNLREILGMLLEESL
jgi:PadR family transcriptional regulator PadR